nr:hypothetical protein [Tanacetum cinerariifolium]
NSYVYDPNPNSFDCPPDSYHPPHPTYETYSYDSYGNDSQIGYDCQPQFPLHYESEQGYHENYNSYPYDSSSLPQQYLCCARCGGPHMNYQCQPMNQDSYNSNSLGFDQPKPPQSPVIHQPPQELSIHEMEDLKQQYLDELKHLSNLEYRDEIKIAELTENLKEDQFEDLSESNEEFSSTDDDSFSFDKIDYVEASPPDSELVSLEMMEIIIPKVGGIKESNDNPIPFYDPIISGTPPNLTPSKESDFFLEGDMLLLEAFLNDDHSSDFKTKSSSTALNSLLEETNNFNNSLPEFTTFSNVFCDAEYESDSKEIIPMESLRTHDSSLPISSKIDSLLEEFTSELTLLKSIPPGIDETDCDFEEDIRLIEKLLYDNSSPRPPKEFVSTNSDAKIKSFSPSPILVKDSDFLMEEIDLFYGDTGILNIKMMGDISDPKDFMHKLMITLAPHQEKSPDLYLIEYEVFHDDHVKEINSGSPTTHSDSSLYASFIFDLSINPFPPVDRSDSYEFTDELIPFISPLEYDYFLFKVEPNSRDFTKDVVEDISPTKEPQVLNALAPPPPP